MGFKCGIVGLPNVGESTLFNMLTKIGVETASFPFCAVELNTGIVSMPDPRLDQLAEIVGPQRTLSTAMESVDIISLVKGAPKGEGLGNQLPTSIRGIEAIGHVVRCFEDDSIIRVSSKVNPADDIEVINTKLALADLDTCKRATHRVRKKARGGDRDAKVELVVLEKCPPQLENAGILRVPNLSAEEKAAARYLSFLVLEPTMYIANINEDGFEDNPYLDQVREIAAKEGSVIVPVCVVIEADVAELDDKKRDGFMQELGLKEPGLNRVIHASYKLLNLQTYFTAGVKEVRAWIILVGATASQAAGKIHTDSGEGLVRTRTISFEDFITYKSEQGVEEAGRIRIEDKDYIVKDDDVMNFLSNVQFR